MAKDIRVPKLGESITEVQVGEWLKAVGDEVAADEPVVTVDSDKAAVEVPAPAAGRLAEILKETGATAKPGDVIGRISTGGGAAAKGEKPEAPPKTAKRGDAREEPRPARDEPAKKKASKKTAGAKAAKAARRKDEDEDEEPQEAEEAQEPRVMPAARRALADRKLKAADVKGTGRGGRVLKEDVESAPEEDEEASDEAEAEGPDETSAEQESGDGERADDETQEGAEDASEEEPEEHAGEEAEDGEAGEPDEEPTGDAGPEDPERPWRTEEVVPMTPLRRRIAERLVGAQQTAALLTTFNEVDMTGVQALRAQHRDAFQERHGVKLGLMSFFVKAAVDALEHFPQLNAEVRGTDVVYRAFHDIGIAVGGGKGLVVPVLRDADRMSFAEVERTIADLAKRAEANRLSPEELQGGTFTISNGGIYGSLLSTPIVNPPQSGILGLHAIQDRPVVRDGEVVVRPMMYVALTYDHRVVDGREAVTFLRRVKETVEDPTRVLLGV